MTLNMSYASVSRVLESWELARQKYGTEEELGKKILLNLLRAQPSIKPVFGFALNQNIEGNPMLLMGVMVHGTRMVQMLDGVLALLGPDAEMLDEVLGGLGHRHGRYGVKKEHFALMGTAVRDAISELYGEAKVFSEEDDQAWKQVFDVLTEKIVSSL